MGKVYLFPKPIAINKDFCPTHINIVGCSFLGAYKTRIPTEMEIVPLVWANHWSQCGHGISYRVQLLCVRTINYAVKLNSKDINGHIHVSFFFSWGIILALMTTIERS